jgi:hypothetical protein
VQTTTKKRGSEEDDAVVEHLDFLMQFQMMQDYDLLQEDPQTPDAP